jgi:hypothetical protein
MNFNPKELIYRMKIDLTLKDIITEKCGGSAKCLPAQALKIGKTGKHFVNGMARADLGDYHAHHRYPHAPDTRLAAHYGGDYELSGQSVHCI